MKNQQSILAIHRSFFNLSYIWFHQRGQTKWISSK